MDTIEAVKNYYGKVLKKSQDMKSGLCNSHEPPPPHLRRLIRNIAGEICEKFYGCGCPIPSALEGCQMLDLGCGTGRDVYLASQLVGPAGFVTGVDMTEEQLAVARRHLDGQMHKFGYSRPNVRFLSGYIEDLQALGIADNTYDVIISDNTINMSPAKSKVFAEIFRVLKPGGELYFCDVFASHRVPDELREDPVLVGECLAGAMYFEDCRRMLREAGCPDARIVSFRKITIDNRAILARCGTIEFHAMTLRAFKLASLEDSAEDYGQVAYYLGTLEGSPRIFTLDLGHGFIPACPMRVSGNTAAMLTETRYASHFHIIGDRGVHYGPFSSLDAMSQPSPAAMETIPRKESSIMMATMQMPPMTGETQRGDRAQQMMPGMMGGMMSPAACCTMMMNMCGMMQNCCQEMTACCKNMMTSSAMAPRCNEMTNCCNQIIACCNEMSGCCRTMMGNPSDMQSQVGPMMACCMDMMACCNMLLTCCRNMMTQMQMLPMMGQPQPPAMGIMNQMMQCCGTCMGMCQQMMACCNMMMACCRNMMMGPSMMMGGMGGMMPGMQQGGMGGMMPGMQQGGMGGMMPGMQQGGMGGMMPGMQQGGMGGMMPGMQQGGMNPMMMGGMMPGMGSMQGMGSMMPGMTMGGMNPMMSQGYSFSI